MGETVRAQLVDASKLPRHLAEVTLESEPLMARYRIAVRDIARDGRFVRLLFDDVFAGWLLERAPQEGCERDRNELRDFGAGHCSSWGHAIRFRLWRS